MFDICTLSFRDFFRFRYNKASQEGDQEHQRLSRILDIAQELKALSFLLVSNLWPFVIDLAVLAARREYLNLDKWLADQLQVNQCAIFIISVHKNIS